MCLTIAVRVTLNNEEQLCVWMLCENACFKESVPKSLIITHVCTILRWQSILHMLEICCICWQKCHQLQFLPLIIHFKNLTIAGFFSTRLKMFDFGSEMNMLLLKTGKIHTDEGAKTYNFSEEIHALQLCFKKWTDTLLAGDNSFQYWHEMCFSVCIPSGKDNLNVKFVILL